MAAETKPRFIPNSNRAIWMALVIPGGGQTVSYTHLNHVEGIQVNKRICLLSGSFLFLCFFYFGIEPSQTGIFIPYLALFIYLMVSELYLKKENPLNNWAYACLLYTSRCV